VILPVVPSRLGELPQAAADAQDAQDVLLSDGGAHLENYPDGVSEALADAIAEAHAAISDPAVTQRRVEDAFAALGKAKAALAQDHPTIRVDTGTPDADGNTPSADFIVEIKGVFEDVTGVWLDGEQLGLDRSPLTKTGAIGLIKDGEEIGTLTAGSAVVTLGRQITYKWGTSTHNVRVTFKDPLGTGEGAADIPVRRVYQVPYDGSYDIDHDGYTDKEEWDAGTDPNDPNSHPGSHKAAAAKGTGTGYGVFNSSDGYADGGGGSANGADAGGSANGADGGNGAGGGSGSDGNADGGSGAHAPAFFTILSWILAAAVVAIIAALYAYIRRRRKEK